MTTISTDDNENQAVPMIIAAQAGTLEASANEHDLCVAFAEHRADLAAGRFVKESVDDHLTRLAFM